MSKKQYLATVGMDFEGLKPKVRIEKDEPIPANITAKEIEDLLKAGLIRESEGKDE